VESGRIVRTIRGEIGEGDPGKIYALALSRDGRLLAAGGRTGAAGQPEPIRLYDLNEGTLIGLLEGHDDAVLSLDFSPDGERLVRGPATTPPSAGMSRAANRYIASPATRAT
jgi:WD40 repeat protein